jgi:DNA invertase Pin-like site-specific DNA recombinase
MRVSTGRQADSDLSIPNQRRQFMAYSAARGWEVAGEFLDAGLSGTDENRPQFQRILDLATGGGKPFDVILVHSYFRFARDLLIIELSARKLKAHAVVLISITQELGSGSTAEITRQFIGMVD